MSKQHRGRCEAQERARRLERQARALYAQSKQSGAIEFLIEKVRRRRRCLLCGGATAVAHVWMPGPELARRFLVPAGQSRAIPCRLPGLARGHGTRPGSDAGGLVADDERFRGEQGLSEVITTEGRRRTR